MGYAPASSCHHDGPARTRSREVHHRRYRQPERQRPVGIETLVDDDLDGYALHDLDEIACGILRGKCREARPAAVLNALHMTMELETGISINFDIDCIARPHAADLRFLEVGGDPDVGRDDEKHGLSGSQIRTALYVAHGDEAVGGAPVFGDCLDLVLPLQIAFA